MQADLHVQADLHRRCYYAKNRFSYDIAQITLSIISIFIASWLFIQTLSSKFEFQYENGGSFGGGEQGWGREESLLPQSLQKVLYCLFIYNDGLCWTKLLYCHTLTHCILGNFSCFLSSADFFQN